MILVSLAGKFSCFVDRFQVSGWLVVLVCFGWLVVALIGWFGWLRRLFDFVGWLVGWLVWFGLVWFDA